MYEAEREGLWEGGIEGEVEGLTLYPRKTSFLIAKTLVVIDERRVFLSGQSGSFVMRSW